MEWLRLIWVLAAAIIKDLFLIMWMSRASHSWGRLTHWYILIPSENGFLFHCSHSGIYWRKIVQKTDKSKKEWTAFSQDCKEFYTLNPPLIKEQQEWDISPLCLFQGSFHPPTSQPLPTQFKQTPLVLRMAMTREDLPTFSLHILPARPLSSKRDCCEMKKKTRNVKWSGNRGNWRSKTLGCTPGCSNNQSLSISFKVSLLE